MPPLFSRPRLTSGLRLQLAATLGLLALGTGAHGATAGSSNAPELTPIGRMITRLAAAPAQTARDWAELGRETVTWGSKLQSEQQAVPEGPVRDALSAVDLGEKLDAKTADWPKLREELQALLKKPDEQKQDQQNQDKNQDQQNKDQKQDQDSQKNDESNPQQPQNSDQKKSDSQKKQDQSNEQNAKPDQAEPKPGESAFGDMKKQDTPPPPPGDTQKVGGAPEKKDLPPEAADPALALPLQKLEQLRSQDSPARLFELMEGERKPPKKTGKDW